jgi:hypothetical protein
MGGVMKRMRWHWSELTNVVTGRTKTHLMLRDRLISLAVATLVIDLVLSIAVFVAERRTPASQILDYPDALFWTTAQLLTVSSNMAAPLTGTGRWLDIFMEIWGITVVAGLAGSLGAFFHRRGLERHPMEPG